ALQLFHAAIAPDEHTGGQVVPIWCSLSVYGVTDAAPSVSCLSMKNAVAMGDLFPAESGWHRQRVDRWPNLFSKDAKRRGHELELLLSRLCPWRRRCCKRKHACCK